MEEKTQEEIDEQAMVQRSIKIIIALFLLLIVVLWALPYYSIKLDPSPNYIPSILRPSQGT